VGISFHITSVREGTLFNVMQFLNLEKVTGILNVSWGRNIPEVLVHFVAGSAAAAEFGGLQGEKVFDVLLCQEYAVKEVNFTPTRSTSFKETAVIKTPSLSGAMLNASKDVDKCAARPYIFGLLPVAFPEAGTVDSLCHIWYEFDAYEPFLDSIKPAPGDKEAPLKECVLLHRALAHDVLVYQTPLISLKSMRPLLELIQPLEEPEAENLRGYMRSLLPHPRATHMPLERFYAFASAIEAIAYRRGTEPGDEARRIIYRLIQSTTHIGAPALNSSPV
jgi:hypothetical protein